MTYMTDTGRVASIFNYYFNASGSLPTRATSPAYNLRQMTAMGTGNGNVSVLSGNTLDAPISLPVNLCGVSLGIVPARLPGQPRRSPARCPGSPATKAADPPMLPRRVELRLCGLRV